MIVTGGTGLQPDGSIFTGTPVLTRAMWHAGINTTGTQGAGNAHLNSGISNGTDTWGVNQRQHYVIADCTDLYLIFCWAGGFEQQSGGPAGSGNPGIPLNGGTISATLWHQSGNPNLGGTTIDILFGGSTTYIIGSEQIVGSDVLTGHIFNKGDSVWIRTMAQVAAGDEWPLGTRTGAVGENGDGGRQGTGVAPGTDYLHTGTIPNISPETRFHITSSRATLL